MKKRIISWILLFSLVFSLSGCEFIGKIIPSLCSHDWDVEIITEATCEIEGLEKRTCKICEKSEENAVPALGHNYSTAWSKNATNHWYDCTQCGASKSSEGVHELIDDGNGGKICSICAYVPIKAEGEISFHFMMLGNRNAGDCIYIKAGDKDILIDGGSRANSVDDIDNYVKQFCADGVLEYVIVTHADQDHIACFAGSSTYDSLFELYECETIIDFPRTNKDTDVYNRYIQQRDAEVNNGAKRYSALECYNNQDGAQRIYNLTDDGSIRMEILYNYYYENKTNDENNYSVCVMFYHGEKQFLFTGDLEKEGEEYLAEKYDFSQVELFKAGHHGSPTSSNDCLLSEIKPKICVACCCAGSVEYTSNLENTFPSQAVIDRIAPYTDMFFVPITVEIIQTEGMDTPNDTSDDKYKNEENYTLLNGNIIVSSNNETGVTVTCSNNNTLLKDTEWFKKYRTMPVSWQSAA